jgi:porphobilinogen synthase
MIHAAAQKGWLDYDSTVLETTLSIKRAGADMIATYFAKDIIRLIG